MLWSRDDDCLARLEMREDLELGWDRHNEQTFGEECSLWCVEAQFHANALLLGSGLDKRGSQQERPVFSALPDSSRGAGAEVSCISTAVLEVFEHGASDEQRVEKQRHKQHKRAQRVIAEASTLLPGSSPRRSAEASASSLGGDELEEGVGDRLEQQLHALGD